MGYLIDVVSHFVAEMQKIVIGLRKILVSWLKLQHFGDLFVKNVIAPNHGLIL